MPSRKVLNTPKSLIYQAFLAYNGSGVVS
jgi:hypothetical protein